MHYLITGHTGFKGSWLSLMLQMQGHTVSGISLDPQEKSLFNQADLQGKFVNDVRLDIRNRGELARTIEEIDPEIIIHLAAQPLVRESYKFPVETFETNVIGTLNVLESTKPLKNLKATLIVTTDKVYKNHNHLRGYVESDELGGDDPYSASKAAADLAAQSWIKSFATSPTAIARAGNVIGGGDWAADRIIPDLVNAYSTGNLPTLRYPDAIRPWQHVLDCLSGYMKLVHYMLATGLGGEWNFGPSLEKFTVGQLTSLVAERFQVLGKAWAPDSQVKFHESGYLLLDSTKSRNLLSWSDKLDFPTSIQWTVAWYKDALNMNILEITEKQILEYLTL